MIEPLIMFLLGFLSTLMIYKAINKQGGKK
jgi:hypothetical protein